MLVPFVQFTDGTGILSHSRKQALLGSGLNKGYKSLTLGKPDVWELPV